jgi:hypothetical protein
MESEESKNRRPLRNPSNKEGRYANFFQVGHNAFEFLIEFGQQNAGIHTRIYLSPEYARVLSDLLLETLQQHKKESEGRKGPDPTVI